jgi:uncharacterized protein YwqG
VRNFYVAHRDYRTSGRLTALPDWLGHWTELERLSVYNFPLGRLPDSIGQLPRLTQLFCQSCALEALPSALCRLPQLEQLMFSGNRLTALPAEIDLPALRHLSLSDNLLEALPDTLTGQAPRLRTLDIQRNPFRRLPAEVLAAIPEVRLEVEVRQQLAPKPPIVGGPYPAEAYRIENDPGRKAELETLLAEAQIGEPAADFFRATATPAIGFTQSPDQTDYGRVGCHRFGGLPDLPAGSEYPRFGADDRAYEFIAQLDCAVLAPLQDYLPRTGFLFFFLSTFHDLYGGDLAYPVALVRYHDVTRADLRPGGPTFSTLTAADYFEAFGTEPTRPGWGTPCYRGFDAEAAPTVGLAPTYAIDANRSLFASVLSEMEVTEDTDLPASEERFDHVSGGYGFSQHELPAVAAANALGGDPRDYVLLLDVQSRGDMQWGDAGELQLVIHKGALAKLDFSRVFAGMYSS